MKKGIMKKVFAGAVSVAMLLIVALSPVFADTGVSQQQNDNETTLLTTSTTEVETKDELTAALTSAASGSVIKLTRDIDLGTDKVTHDNGMAITIDLNGFELKSAIGSTGIITVDKDSSITVDDSSVRKTGKLTSTNGNAIYNYSTGDITVNGGTLTATSASGIYNYSTGDITVNGGTISATGNYSDAIYNSSIGNITVNGGTITITSSNPSIGAINNRKTGTVTVNGGNISSIVAPSSAVKNNARVDLKRYTISKLKADAKVTVFTTDLNYIYGLNGVHTDAKGNLYVWLPKDGGPDSVAVTAGGKAFQGWMGSVSGPDVVDMLELPPIEVATAEALKTAFGTVTDGSTIKLTANIDLGEDKIEHNNGNTIILDLNDFELKSAVINNAVIMMSDKSSLVVDDSSESKAGMLTAIDKAILNTSTGDITVNSGTITSTGGNSTVINANSTGDITVNGGTITVTGNNVYAISNAEGTVTVNGGSISSIEKFDGSGDKVRAVTNKDGVALIKYTLSKLLADAKVTLLTTNPSYTYGLNGVYTDAKGDLYVWLPEDVTTVSLIASDKAYTGTIIGDRADMEALQPIEVETAEALKSAFNTAQDGSTIKLTANVDLGQDNVEHNNDKTITLDLNGLELKSDTRKGIIAVINKSRLVVDDSSANKAGKITATGQYGSAIYHGGTGDIKVNGGTLTATGLFGYAISNNSTGNIIVNGGSITATDREYRAICNYDKGTVTINGGTIITTGSSASAIYNNNTGTVKVNGGNISSIKNGSGLEIPKNKGGVALKPYLLYGLGADAKVTAFTTDSKYTYGLNDVRTDANGSLYVWLPDGVKSVSLTAGEKVYNGEFKDYTFKAPSEIPTYTISVTDGTADKSTAKENDTVKITATVPSGKTFKEWKITPDVTFVNNTSKTSNVAEFTMPASNVSAVVMYTDDTVAEYTVSVSGGTADKSTAKENDTVKITANVSSGKTFKEWKITPDVTFVNNTNKTSETAEFKMPASNVTAVATYIDDKVAEYTVSVSGGTADKSTAKENDTVKITANVPSGKTFKEWNVSPNVTFVNNTSKTSKVAEFKMPASNVNVSAVYVNASKPSTGGGYSGGSSSVNTDYSKYITDGAGQTVEKNNNGVSSTVTFRIDMPLSSFNYVESGKDVLVNGKDYTVKEGSTIITLTSSYLNTLSVGKHKITVTFLDGSADLEFEIKATPTTPTKPTAPPAASIPTSKNPQTGDSWFSGLFF